VNAITRVKSVFKFGFENKPRTNLPIFGSEFKKPTKAVLRKLRAKNGEKSLEASQIRTLIEAAGVPLSRGSLSEASQVFDPELLHAIIGDLAAKTLHLLIHGKEAEALRGLTAVDGSLLPALPKMAWALWVDSQNRAAKMHIHFDVLKGVPVEATLTTGNGSETEQLRAALQALRLYVIDRGYAEYQLFQDIIDAGSDFIGHIRDNAVWTVVKERPLSPAAIAAGVLSDREVRLGCPKSGAVFKQTLRVIKVLTGKKDAKGRLEILLLATNRLDLDAELVALGYRFRWAVELFFRWFKCILGCRHLLANSPNGVTIQVYLAIIASILISLCVGRKPTPLNRSSPSPLQQARQTLQEPREQADDQGRLGFMPNLAPFDGLVHPLLPDCKSLHHESDGEPEGRAMHAAFGNVLTALFMAGSKQNAGENSGRDKPLRAFQKFLQSHGKTPYQSH
jgi:hypothetical protein